MNHPFTLITMQLLFMFARIALLIQMDICGALEMKKIIISEEKEHLLYEEAMLEEMYHHFVKHPETMGNECRFIEHEGVERVACDYIAGMTDRYAVSKFNEIFVPDSWGG